VIISILLIWNILGVYLKDFIKASFLTLLLTLPFNIAYELPLTFLDIQLSNPFVDGVIVNYLVPTVFLLDLGVILLLFSIIIQKGIKLKSKGLSFLKIFIIFGIFLLLQSILKNSFISLLNSLRLLLYLFTFYNLGISIKKLLTNRMLVYLLIVSLLLVISQGLIALLQFSGGTSLGLTFLGESKVVSGMRGSSFLNLNGSLYLRGYGTFPHPNVFGGWLIFNILLGWYLFNNMKKKRDYSIILMGLSSLVLVFTFSRISFLVTLIIGVVFIIKVFISSKSLKLFSFTGLLFERVLNLFTGGDTSWGDRVGLMKSSFHVIKENLFTGVGLGKFVANMKDTVPRSENGILILQPVHNIFLLIISEIGVVGFPLFCSLVYFFIKRRKWSLRFVMGLVSLFVVGMFDHYLISLPQGLVIFLLIMVI
jgi:O-antigen ligase